MIWVVTHRYIDTANDNDEAVAKLIKLFNGAKWRGRFLKYRLLDFDSFRVEIAKPSYLDRIQEERERLANGNIPKPEEEIEHIKTEPLSGIENTFERANESFSLFLKIQSL